MSWITSLLPPIRRVDFQAAYLSLGVDEVRRRAAEAIASLASCRVCPRNCEVDRLADETQACFTGRYARVGSHFSHFGEEDCLRGWRGSGTIFFSFCNLRCVFCQNWDVSQDGSGAPVGPDRLAEMMLELQAQGCHNINFVTPEHVVPQVLEALPLAMDGGLRVPLVYNTSAYDSLESLRWMDGIVDIYMPDFKFWDEATSKRLMKASDYPEVARGVLREMHRQVGALRHDEQGIAVRGVLVRHLVMPSETAGTREIMRFLTTELSPDTYVNVMDQYTPQFRAWKQPDIARTTTSAEHRRAVEMAVDEGIWRIDERRPYRWRESLELSRGVLAS